MMFFFGSQIINLYENSNINSFKRSQKNLSQKARLVASMIRPLLWLFIIGSGFNQIVDIENSGNYFSFLIPGLICMTALFTGVVSSMSIVYDKEFGFIRLLYLSPSLL